MVIVKKKRKEQEQDDEAFRSQSSLKLVYQVLSFYDNISSTRWKWADQQA